MALADIERLIRIAEKPSRLIVGLMSGTSLDGLDVALCRISGTGTASKVKVLEFETHGYKEDFKEDIRKVFSKKQVDLDKLCLLNALTASYHAELVLKSLKKWQLSGEEIDCIASHGQTIYHAPKRLHKLEHYPNATLQIGDGDHLAVKTGIITISDFRQKHVAAGGEGAPLALYGDQLLFSSPDENRVLLNIGGIANFTFLPADGDTSKIISTDAGPGNTLTDALARRHFDMPFDEGGKIALSGKPDNTLLNVLLQAPFFSEALPKTTGPELFNLQYFDEAVAQSGAAEISPEDLMATAAQLTPVAITNALRSLDRTNKAIYISGGGCYNEAMAGALRNLMPECEIKDFESLGINPDAKEAVLFAVLANECLAGSRNDFKNAPSVSMGKISLPN